MRFKSLKNLTLGKSKEKPEEDGDEFKDIAADRVANMEKRIYDRTKDLEKKAKEIQELSTKSDISEVNGDITKGPHGPLSELTLENGDDLAENSLPDVLEVDKSDVDEDGDGIKLVEVSADTIKPQENEEEDQVAEAGASPDNPPDKEGKARESQPVEASAESAKNPEKGDETKLDDKKDSLTDLFSNEEEVENPLANLIRSLPDVTAQEIIDDLNEIKGIIKEWQKK